MNQPAKKINPMRDLEEQARRFARTRNQLALAATAAERELQTVREKHAKKLSALLAVAADCKAALEADIDRNRDLFEKPKTRVVDGIRFGLRKQNGTVEIKDEERTIQKIRALLPEEQAELLIRVRESVDKNAVKDLQVKDLKRLGIEVTRDTDVPVVKAADKDIDKQIEAATNDLGVKS